MAKITADNEHLLAALTAVGKVSQTSTNSPILRCVLVVAKNGKLRLRGTDLSTYVERIIPYEGTEEGAWLVVYDAFNHYVKSSSGKMTLEFTDASLKMRSGKDSATAKLRDVNEYTQWPKWQDLKLVDADASAVVDAVKNSTNAVSTAVISLVLYCVSIRSVEGGKGIDIQASDSYRYQFTTVTSSPKTSVNILLPHNVATRFADIEMPARELGVSDRLLGIRSKRGTYFFSLANDADKYPTLRSMSRPKPSLTIVSSYSNIVDVFKKAEGFTEDPAYKKVKLDADQTGIQVSVSSREIGTYSGKIDAVKGKGKPLALYVDAGHIISFLGSVKSDSVIFQFSDSEADHRPIILKDPGNPDFLYLTYPLVTKEE